MVPSGGDGVFGGADKFEGLTTCQVFEVLPRRRRSARKGIAISLIAVVRLCLAYRGAVVAPGTIIRLTKNLATIEQKFRNFQCLQSPFRYQLALRCTFAPKMIYTLYSPNIDANHPFGKSLWRFVKWESEASSILPGSEFN